MKIKMMISLLIAFYATLVLLVSFGIYGVTENNKRMHEIEDLRFLLLSKYDSVHYSKIDSSLLLDTQNEMLIIREDTNSNIYFIYVVMSIALISFIFTYILLRRKILEPIFKMNEVIMSYQSGAEVINQFESHNDEIGLMIKEFFKMKRMLDDDYLKVEQLAFTDPLTEIFNRRAFFEVSEKILSLSMRNDTTFSIILIDIDHFKEVNDNYGHLIGDKILKFLVQNVSKEIRESDIFARYGGEEFIIILPNTQEEGALALALKVRESIESNHYLDNALEVPITISAGIASFKRDKSLQEVISRADKALYSAKENGRNRVEIA